MEPPDFTNRILDFGRMMDGENRDSKDPQDIAHWRAVYTEMVRFKEGLLAQAQAEIEKVPAMKPELAGNDIPIAVSIGVAQWSREMGTFPDRLIAAADHALYAAKKEGKNRYAVYQPTPPLAPKGNETPAAALRKLA